MLGAVIPLKLLGTAAMQRWQSYFHQCCTCGMRRAMKKLFLRILFFLLGWWKNWHSLKQRCLFFLLMQSQQKRPCLHCFPLLIPLQDNGFAGNKNAKILWLQYPHTPTTLYIAVKVISFCCTDSGFKEMEITKNRNAIFLVRHLIMLTTPLLRGDGEDVSNIYTRPPLNVFLLYCWMNQI